MDAAGTVSRSPVVTAEDRDAVTDKKTREQGEEEMPNRSGLERRSGCLTERNRRDASSARSEEGAYREYVTDERRSDAKQIGDFATEGNPFGVLAATILILVWSAFGCSDRNTQALQGAEGGACYPNGTCDTGLSCLASGICAKPSSSDARIDSKKTGTDAVIRTDVVASDNFSFFVMSLERIKKWGGEEGLGGNLGGLAGADAKCQEAAEAVGSHKTWHAFLSVTDDGTGKAVNAIDRIGTGPWYNVKGLLVAKDIAGLLHTRPDGATDVVYNDGWKNWPFNQCLTTEFGNCNLSYGDTHDTLTGSNRQGKLYSTDSKYTCNNWTSTDVNVQLQIGHSWPRQLNNTDDGESNWIQAHSNCTSGGPGGPGGGGTCNGCKANINIGNTMEEGIGGDGGYGAWYCFAID
jgi:hypothetical protein